MAAGHRRSRDVRGGSPPVHRRDQRGRAGREGGRRDRDRRHGLSRRRRRLDVQLAAPRGARPRLRVRRAERVDRIRRVPRERRRRSAVRRHARDGGNARRRARAHGQRIVLVAPAVQRRRGGRDGHQRSALRHLGLPGGAGHRRRGCLPRRPRTARGRPDDGSGEARPRPVQCASASRRARAGVDRGGPRDARSRTARRSSRTTPARRARSWSTSTPRISSSRIAIARASRSPLRGRSPRARTTGGRPGGSSSSRRGGYLLTRWHCSPHAASPRASARG